MKTQSQTLLHAASALLGRSQPRWLVILTSGLTLIVLFKIALAASQIFTILNATYAASQT